MKSIVADTRYKVYCVRIVPVTGQTVYLTDHVRDLLIGGSTYKTDSGYQFTGIVHESNMSPGVLDLSGISGVAGINADAIASGVFDNARVYAFATSWLVPVVDEEPIGCAILGKTIQRDDRYSIEMMMLVDALNQSVGSTYTPACQKRFGGQEYAGCKFVLAPVTVTGTITSVTSTSIFRDSARTQPADYFAAGTIAFTGGGANAGLKALEIKRYESDGTIETYEGFHYPVQIGDSYYMIPGCRKRLEDCRDKWNNVVNFGGFSFIPTQSTYGQVGNRQ